VGLVSEDHELHAAPPVHPLIFEAGQIEQLLINILDNAYKFAPRGGSIELRG
jgi:signal transduction histidine kinase